MFRAVYINKDPSKKLVCLLNAFNSYKICIFFNPLTAVRVGETLIVVHARPTLTTVQLA